MSDSTEWSRLRIPDDVVILPEIEGRWVLMNVFARTCLGVDTRALEVLRNTEPIDREGPFRAWRIGWFSNGEGLLADPTRYRRAESEWVEVDGVSAKDLISLFIEHFLLIEDEEEYLARFQQKDSMMDRQHFGNFHQQLAQNVMLERRQKPGEWWIDQKFSRDRKSIRNNLYQAVQEHHLKAYFPRVFKPDDRVIDLGCGIGHYTKMIGRTGAQVLGVDPTEAYISEAKKSPVQGVTFQCLPVGEKGGLGCIPESSADAIFMSDVLLFYFVSPIPDPKATLGNLFQDIHRILKADGKLISVEPHYLFWLLPWLGSEERPFTILTEYTTKTFGVTPTLSDFIQCFANEGFVVTWMDELKPSGGFESTDSRGYHFGSQFPLWQLLEFQRSSSIEHRDNRDK